MYYVWLYWFFGALNGSFARKHGFVELEACCAFGQLRARHDRNSRHILSNRQNGPE